LRELKKRLGVVVAGVERFEGADLFFETGFFGGKGASFAVVGPKLGQRGKVAELFYPARFSSQVKATPEGNRASSSSKPAGRGFHGGLKSVP
jgi:hypothetical protein